MLDARSKTLLKTLIERYIADGEPVGSRTLSKHTGLDLSPATIRNVMSDLEELGFIQSPHTSAGRIPTPRGYRLFVDSLMVSKPLPQGEVAQVAHELTEQAQPQQVVQSAAKLLSALTSFAGVVMTPRRTPVYRQLEFVRLAEKRILLILVTPEGDVQNRILSTPHNYSQSQLIEAANFLNSHYSGLSFDDIQTRLAEELKTLRGDIADLMSLAVVTGQQVLNNSDDVVIAGERRLLQNEGNMEQIRQLFGMFEQKTQLLHLLHASGEAQGVQIFIGEESGVKSLDEFSMVTASYQVNGQVLGTLGVIGPTRMAYERVIPIVDITAKLMSTALSQNK
ncbi:MAG: hypothetical protein RLZZ502_329 [Pseudomonadota bacterium]|jgi:heat-inducible transcriptional repressor